MFLEMLVHVERIKEEVRLVASLAVSIVSVARGMCRKKCQGRPRCITVHSITQDPRRECQVLLEP